MSFCIPSSDSNERVRETIRLVIVVDDAYFLNTAYFSATGVKRQLTLSHIRRTNLLLPCLIQLTLAKKLLFLNQIYRLLPLTHHSLVHHWFVIAIHIRTSHGQIRFHLRFRHRVRIKMALRSRMLDDLTFLNSMLLVFIYWGLQRS